MLFLAWLRHHVRAVEQEDGDLFVGLLADIYGAGTRSVRSSHAPCTGEISKYHSYMLNGNPFPMDTKVTFALPNQTFAASLRRGWFL
jgi:hypothetical protein